MAIIIREEKTLPNGVKTVVKSYISDISPLPGHLRRKADENDEMIKSKVHKIEEDLEGLGLFNFKGKTGVLKLWYEFGSRLKFIENMNLSSSAKQHIWRAIYDHTKKLYDKTEPIPKRLKDRPMYNDIKYSFQISKFDWAFVRTAGSWRTWVDFLDSTVMREDHRIIQWIASIQEKTSLKTGFLRILRRAISEKFRNTITSELSETDLYRTLNEIYEEEKEALGSL